MTTQTRPSPVATRRLAWTLAAMLGTLSGAPFASEPATPATGAAVAAADDTPKAESPAAAPKKAKVVESRGYGTRAETEPPRYVRRASETGYDALRTLDWLQLGADYRARYEYRHHDYRRDTLSDDPLLLRTRVFLGIDRIIDPLRLGVELQDSRLVHSEVPDSSRDVNKSDVLQAYAELYGRDLLGAGEPMRLQVGRLAFEYLDRRLVSRNPWRNTTNNFEGFRLLNGSRNGLWWLDLLAVKPVAIKPDEPDNDDRGRWFYGALGSYSGWSELVTLQPFLLVLDEDLIDRRIVNWGLRGYGVFDSGFDYDFDLSLQTGHSGGQDHRAQAASFEIGYTYARPWTPRVSAFIGYASGDDDPDDDESNRFNRLFGFGRPWSANDYHVWENVITPKARIEIKPGSTLQLEGGYGGFWLASDSDSWSNAGRRDRSGRSGDFIGHEIDGRIRWRADPRLEVIAGYAHFFPGGFTENTGPSPDADFFYLELSFQVFR